MFMISILFVNFLIPLISANYTYTEIQGNIRNEFNFSVFIESFIGIVMYGINSKNDKFLIGFEEDEYPMMFVRFNRVNNQEKLENLCECQSCSNVYMTFIVRLYKLQVITKCNGIEKHISIDKLQLIGIEQFRGYPLPVNHSLPINKSKIWIWMGNIGYYKESGNKITRPFKNQLTGCLDKFYLNNRIVTFEQRGHRILKTCPKEYNETVYYGNNSLYNKILYEINDCFLTSINTRYCKKVLPIFSETNNLYEIKKPVKFPIIVRLEWKQFFLRNYCLLDIKMKMNKSIMIYLNKMNEISFLKIDNQSIITEKSLVKVTENGDNLLLIIYNRTDFIIKTTKDNNIFTFIESFSEEPIQFNIGNLKNQSFCQTFEGAIDIYSDSIKKSISLEFSISENLKIILFWLGIFIVSIVFFYFVLYSVKRNIKILYNKMVLIENYDGNNNVIKTYEYIKQISDPISLDIYSNDEIVYETVTNH